MIATNKSIWLALPMVALLVSNNVVADDQVDEAFGINGGVLINMPLAQSASQPLKIPSTLNVIIDGVQQVIDIYPFDVRGDSYKFMVQGNDGVLGESVTSPVNTFRGRIRGQHDSIVAGGFTNNGCNARIKLGDGREFWLEPVAGHVAGHPAGEHVLYQASDVAPQPGVDFQGDVIPSSDAAGAVNSPVRNLALAAPALGAALVGQPPVTAAIGSTGRRLQHVAQVAIDTDSGFFLTNMRDFGRTTVQQQEAFVRTLVALVAVPMQRDLGIHYVLSGVIIRPDSATDPYRDGNPNIPGNQRFSLFPALLVMNNAFTSAGIVHDIGQVLSSNIGPSGPVLGTASGEACARVNAFGEPLGYSFADVFKTVFRPPTHRMSIFSMATLMAHEMGHNWGAAHDLHGIMNPGSNPGALSVGTFSSASRLQVQRQLAKPETAVCLDIRDLGEEAILTGMTVTDGTLSQPITGIAELDVSDEQRIRLIMDNTGVAGSLHTAAIEADLVSPLPAVSKLLVTVETGAGNPPPGQRTFVYLWDFQKGRWQQIGRVNQTADDQEQVIPVVAKVNTFVGVGGAIRARIMSQHNRPNSAGSQDLSIDHLDVGVFP